MGFHRKSFRFEGGGRQNEIGLKRTGKSCRLRWVNYLHPGLKRGKMTPHEERLVLELHSKWGNRWSRIARKLPGRTDNEIKNYWRTYMRKKAQEKKRASSPSSSLSNSSSMASIYSSNSTNTPPPVDSMPITGQTDERSFYDTGGLEMVAGTTVNNNKSKNNNYNNSTSNVEEVEEECYSMDEIWKDIDLLEDGMSMKPVYDPYSNQLVSSPTWDYSLDSLWTTTMDGTQGLGEIGYSNMFFPAMARLTG